MASQEKDIGKQILSGLFARTSAVQLEAAKTYAPFPVASDDVFEYAGGIAASLAKYDVGEAGAVAVGISAKGHRYVAVTTQVYKKVGFNNLLALCPKPAWIVVKFRSDDAYKHAAIAAKAAGQGSAGCAEKRIVAEMIHFGDTLKGLAVVGDAGKSGEKMGSYTKLAGSSWRVVQPCKSCKLFLETHMKSVCTKEEGKSSDKKDNTPAKVSSSSNASKFSDGDFPPLR